MIAYEFYFVDEEKRETLIGILPEKRKDPTRITRESIMKWIKNVVGNQFDMQNVYYIEVKYD